jgi:molecular chaperone DnaK
MIAPQSVVKIPQQPVAPPTAPTLAPPTAPTLALEPSAASTARGIGPAPEEDTDTDIATTARGFAAPVAAAVVASVAPSGVPAIPARPAPIVLDVTPRGLGIATVAGYCEELIRRNARLPAETRKLFTTSRDRQDVVRIIVCQGESRRLDHNVVIADLTLDNLPPRPRGETSIEVTFALDASGILQVRARDPQTGQEQRASLDIVGTLPHEDIAASRERLQSLRR